MIKRIALMLFIGLGFNLFSFSQDSIPQVGDLKEEKNLKFQEYFFQALSEKAIRNYQKAIGHLETCNEILPNNPIVYFEFSKNYYQLNQTQLAKEYIDRAIAQDPENKWMKLHLVKIFKKEKNYSEAIKVQKTLVSTSKKRLEELVYLHLYNRDYVSAMDLMNDIESKRGLSKQLRDLKDSLENRKAALVKKSKKNDLTSLIKEFDNNSTLLGLVKILEKTQDKNLEIFDRYSQRGLNLFPAQPSIYIFRAKALFQKKQFDEALLILQTGIDFVVDNKIMIKLFYEEMAKNYQSLGQEEQYLQMMKKIKEL